LLGYNDLKILTLISSFFGSRINEIMGREKKENDKRKIRINARYCKFSTQPTKYKTGKRKNANLITAKS